MSVDKQITAFEEYMESTEAQSCLLEFRDISRRNAMYSAFNAGWDAKTKLS